MLWVNNLDGFDAMEDKPVEHLSGKTMITHDFIELFE